MEQEHGIDLTAYKDFLGANPGYVARLFRGEEPPPTDPLLARGLEILKDGNSDADWMKDFLTVMGILATVATAIAKVAALSTPAALGALTATAASFAALGAFVAAVVLFAMGADPLSSFVVSARWKRFWDILEHPYLTA